MNKKHERELKDLASDFYWFEKRTEVALKVLEMSPGDIFLFGAIMQEEYGKVWIDDVVDHVNWEVKSRLPIPYQKEYKFKWNSDGCSEKWSQTHLFHFNGEMQNKRWTAICGAEIEIGAEVKIAKKISCSKCQSMIEND